MYHNDECLIKLGSCSSCCDLNYFGVFDLNTEKELTESKIGEFVAFSMTLTTDRTKLILIKSESIQVMDLRRRIPVSTYIIKYSNSNRCGLITNVSTKLNQQYIALKRLCTLLHRVV